MINDTNQRGANQALRRNRGITEHDRNLRAIRYEVLLSLRTRRSRKAIRVMHFMATLEDKGVPTKKLNSITRERFNITSGLLYAYRNTYGMARYLVVKGRELGRR